MSRTTAVKGAEPLWRRQKVLALRVFDTDWSRAAPWAQRAVNCVAQCDGLFANIIGAPHWRGPTVEYAPRLAARDSLRPGLAGVTTSDPLVSPAQKSDFCAVSMGWLTDHEPLTQWYYDCPAPQPDYAKTTEPARERSKTRKRFLLGCLGVRNLAYLARFLLLSVNCA